MALPCLVYCSAKTSQSRVLLVLQSFDYCRMVSQLTIIELVDDNSGLGGACKGCEQSKESEMDGSG